MSRFNSDAGRFGKHAMRQVREQKRLEAEVRQESASHVDTKRHRLGKCDCRIQVNETTVVTKKVRKPRTKKAKA